MWIDCVPPVEEAEALEDANVTETQGTLPGCSAEVHRCAGGQFVARAPELNCEFYPCPEESAGSSGTVAAEAFSDGGVDGSEAMTENSEVVVDQYQGEAAGSEWGTIPLTFASPKCEGECTMCQGDCNSDDDCAEGLKCFSRGSGEVTAVPGCVSGGEGDLAGMDYCYLPEPPTTTSTTTTEAATTTTTTEDPAEPLPELNFVRECTADLPCNACEGDCDDNSQCAEGLMCFSRVQGSVLFVPGCVGTGIAGMDYCYDPNAPIILPATEAATTSPPEQQEVTGCSAEVQACPGSSVFVYRNPAKNCEFDPCESSSSSTTSPNDERSTTVAAGTTNAAVTTPVGETIPNAVTTSAFDATTTPNADGTTPIPVVTMSAALGGTTPNSGTQPAATEAAAVTCDTLCLDELPSSFCPTEMDTLPDCLSIEIGHICEARGECATNDGLNNCQTFDVYVRVECGGSTPTQGELMNNPQASEDPVAMESALGNDASPGDNVTIVSTDGGNSFEGQGNNVTVAVSDNTTLVSDTASQGSTVAPVDNLTSVVNPVPTTLAPTPEVNATVDFSNLTLQTASGSVSNAAASFTYDRSPEGKDVFATDETTSEYFAEDYSNEPGAVSNSAYNPYDQNEGWDLNGFDSGYFTPGATNSASVNSRGFVVILGLVTFALIV
jgi:hypothetical protein